MLFDKNSSMEMAKIGVYAGYVDLFAVEAADALRCQTPPPPQNGTFSVRLHYSGVMIGSSPKHYIGGEVQHIDYCDPDRWSKLEVDDVLEKLRVDVSKLEYYYLKPRMTLDDGLVRLFDNLSSMEMAELGVKEGLLDLYVVDINDVLVSQITQDSVGSVCVDVADVGTDVDLGVDEGGKSRDRDGGMADLGNEGGAMCVDLGTDAEGDVGAHVDSIAVVESGDGEDMDYEGDGQYDNSGKGIRSVVAEDEAAEDQLFIDSDYDLSDHEEDAIMAGDEQFEVNLKERVCSCRRWMLTGIPCPHAIAAIELTSEDVDSFVSNIYSKETFQHVYAPIIYPLLGPKQWTRTAQPDEVPPELMRLPGRPKGARQKSVQESQEIKRDKARAARFVRIREDADGIMNMSRKGMMSDYKCRLCGKVGHNKRKCPDRQSEAGTSCPKPATGRKRKPSEEPQKCSLCRQPGHNRTRCTSAIADMFAAPAASVMGESQSSSSKVNKT